MENQNAEEKIAGAKSVLYLIEEIFCFAALSLLALFPVVESIARLFRTGILGSSAFTSHLLLFTGLLCGMICTRNEGHMAISLVHYVPEGKIKPRLKTLCNLVSAFTAVVIAWSSVSFIKLGLEGNKVGIISDRILSAIIPIAFVVIGFRFARRTYLTGWKKVLPVLAILLGTIASFPVIAKIIWGFDMPDSVFNICDKFFIFTCYVKMPFIILLILAAFCGTPLFIVMGGLALILMQSSGGEMDSVAADVYSALTNQNIIAIPLFTIVGFFLSESKAGERLVHTFRSFFSWLPGGIIIVTVVICAFFTSFTGASGVTILALGGILYTILKEHLKYPEEFSIGLLTSAGSIGLLFPPSLPLILVGTVTQTNIFHLFLGGIAPGLILVLAVVIFGIIISVKTKIPVEKFEGRKALLALKDSAFEILLPALLVAGYFSGVLSLVEIGAAAVLYIFIVEVFINRDVKLSEIKKVFDKAIPIIGGVLSILALSKALSYYIVDTQAPANIAAWMYKAISSKFVFLLILNLSLLVVGCLMDIFSAILIVLPLIVPLGQIYGIDPVHLGIIFIVNLEVGYITPPVGLNLFLASFRFKKPFVEICRYVSPFLLVRLFVVLLVTYIPWLSTFLIRE
ncbi:MAG: TRAP transporter large permease subunit [Treponema sp.]|nr:TRAP transporter large permease subunit [Treponema sp.]